MPSREHLLLRQHRRPAAAAVTIREDYSSAPAKMEEAAWRRRPAAARYSCVWKNDGNICYISLVCYKPIL